MKIALCTPCTDQVAALFCHDYARMVAHTIRVRPMLDMMSLYMPGSLISKQREHLALSVLEEPDYTHVLWLDSDMRFPPDTLLRMLAHNKRMVCANYVERRKPYRPIAFPTLETPWVRRFTERADTGLERIDAIGLGCLLMDTDVFRKLSRPWFAVGWVEETQEYIGEDLYFLAKCRAAGEELWLDHDLSKEVRHIGTHEFSMEEAYQARENGLMNLIPDQNAPKNGNHANAMIEGAAVPCGD